MGGVWDFLLKNGSLPPIIPFEYRKLVADRFCTTIGREREAGEEEGSLPIRGNTRDEIIIEKNNRDMDFQSDCLNERCYAMLSFRERVV